MHPKPGHRERLTCNRHSMHPQMLSDDSSGALAFPTAPEAALEPSPARACRTPENDQTSQEIPGHLALLDRVLEVSADDRASFCHICGVHP